MKTWKVITRWAITKEQNKIAAYLRDHYAEAMNSWDFFQQMLEA